MSHIFISELKTGDKVNQFFLVKRKERRRTRNGKDFLDLTLADKTGSLNGKIWSEHLEGLEPLFSEGQFAGVAGRVEALRPRPGFRVPNIGWYQLKVRRPGALFADCSPSGSFYFVHSYHLVAKDPQAVSAVIDYGGQEVVAGIESGNLFGVQFHPEKSQDSGLDLLSAFVAHLQERDGAK